jgi:hypothetical protein
VQLSDRVWIYRDGKRSERADSVLAELRRRLARVHERSDGDARRREAVDALVVAGEVEAAIADADLPDRAPIERITDILAEIALGRSVALELAIAEAARVHLPERSLVMSTPEGFAYYALHPEAYAAAMSQLGVVDDVLVVGIRSIGTALGAIARAALSARGARARRVTVRPGGLPYDRRLATVVAPPPTATVVIVDEGPGLSGSTFLATAEAFVRAGVLRERIVLVCSHPPDFGALRAPDAVRRWGGFRTLVAGTRVHLPPGRDVSGGAWRDVHYASSAAWPAAFVSAERLKVLEHGRLCKYEGMGLRAAAARDRGAALASEGLAPPIRDEGDGWASYPWDGNPLQSRDLDDAILAHIARYCARRAALFGEHGDATAEFLPALRKNAVALVGLEDVPELVIERPTIIDGRMPPHEWLRTARGILKADAMSHGDDHFFPGPTDIAWDLAGVIVEWGLGRAARARLLEIYRRESGDDAFGRIDGWIFAYAVTRGALAAFARDAIPGAEGERFARALRRYVFAASYGSTRGAPWRGVRRYASRAYAPEHDSRSFEVSRHPPTGLAPPPPSSSRPRSRDRARRTDRDPPTRRR